MGNYMKLTIKAISINESFARSAVAAFCVQLNPTLDQINDIKTAVSEAVTNAVVHAYDVKPNSAEGKPSNAEEKIGDIEITCEIQSNKIHIAIRDFGIGITDLAAARKPFFTTKPEQERSGMGFTVMESFMDTMEVETSAEGTTVRLSKNIGDK